MNEKQIKAFVSFLSDNNVSLNDMYQALSGPKPGDIYFTDNSYFAYPLPGRTAKGVFVTSNCYVTNSRSSDELGYTKAKIFCFFQQRRDAEFIGSRQYKQKSGCHQCFIAENRFFALALK